MKKVDAVFVRSILEKHQASGLHVDERLWREVDQPGEMFLEELATREEFLRLVWQSGDATRPLTPVGESRTLFDCAGRLSRYEWKFQALVQAGFEWFRPSVDIDTAFEYDKVGLVAITPLIESEERETPAGNYYIYDGVQKHRFGKEASAWRNRIRADPGVTADAPTVVRSIPSILNKAFPGCRRNTNYGNPQKLRKTQTRGLFGNEDWLCL